MAEAIYEKVHRNLRILGVDTDRLRRACLAYESNVHGRRDSALYLYFSLIALAFAWGTRNSSWTFRVLLLTQVLIMILLGVQFLRNLIKNKGMIHQIEIRASKVIELSTYLSQICDRGNLPDEFKEEIQAFVKEADEAVIEAKSQIKKPERQFARA